MSDNLLAAQTKKRQVEAALKHIEPFSAGYDPRFDDRQEEAKEALLAFFEEFRKIEPENDISLDTFELWHSTLSDYYYFWTWLFRAIKYGAMEKKYSIICNEIFSMGFYEQKLLYQTRIYTALMHLYHAFLE